MARLPHSSEYSQEWSPEARALAQRAKVLSGNKLEQLVVRLQRHSGRPKETCWRFIIQRGLKGKVDHRRWTEDELETLREELVKRSIEEVAKKLNRTPQAIRSTLKRNHLRVREIRCDLFSVESLAAALHVRKSEIRYWIDQNWLPATMNGEGRRLFYIITPEGLIHLYKHHRQDVLRRGIPNQSLFEAYVQYCYSPKHTVGEQLLDVRRDKRERAAFSALSKTNLEGPDAEDDDGDEGRYRLQL
ncbi:MAG TPA: hypothetical protein VK638_25935 [Edaphobacter sp.]|nr:hypothetical protein [Edaphobacter sp.]